MTSFRENNGDCFKDTVIFFFYYQSKKMHSFLSQFLGSNLPECRGGERRAGWLVLSQKLAPPILATQDTCEFHLCGSNML